MKIPLPPGPRWTYTCITVAAVMWLTLVPQPLPEMHVELFPGADKIVHGIMFGGVVLAAGFDEYRQRRIPSASFLIVAAMAAIVFGGVIEILQANVIPGRSGDTGDFIGDAIGVVVAALIARPALRGIFQPR